MTGEVVVQQLCRTTEGRIKPENKIKAVGFQLLAIICGSLGPTLFKKMQASMEPVVIVIYMMLSGSIAMFVLSLMYDNLQRKSRNRLLNKRVIAGIVVAAFCGSLYYWMFIIAMVVSSIVETSIIARFSPVVIAVLSVPIFGEKITSWTGFIIGASICFSSLFIQYGATVISKTINSFLPYALVVMAANAVMIVSERYAQRYGDKSLKCAIVGLKMLSAAFLTMLWGIEKEYLFGFTGDAQDILFQVVCIIILGVVTVSSYFQDGSYVREKAYHFLRAIQQRWIRTYTAK